MGINPDNTTFIDVVRSGIKKFKAGEIAVEFTKMGTEIFDTVMLHAEWHEKAMRITEELEIIAREVGPPLGDVGRTALNNTGIPIVKGVTIDLLPYVLVAMTTVIATPLTLYYLYRKAAHQIGSPQLATEIHQHTIFTPLTEWTESAASNALGLSPKKKMAPYFQSRNHAPYRRVEQRDPKHPQKGRLLCKRPCLRPGGTGKTMVSEYIAVNSGMSYIKMSGGDLAQYIKRGRTRNRAQ